MTGKISTRTGISFFAEGIFLAILPGSSCDKAYSEIRSEAKLHGSASEYSSSRKVVSG